MPETEIKNNRNNPQNPLNLPPSALKFRDLDGVREVYDSLRQKWVALTPEEIVRQLFCAWLINHKAYPPSRMANEVGLKLNGMIKRCDTIVYDEHLLPLVVIEYKAPSVKITQKVFDQIARYNMVVKAKLLIVSNGINHYCCLYQGAGYTFLREIPDYPDI